MNKKRIIICLIMSVVLLYGCSNKLPYGLDTEKPTPLTIWHYYNGAQKQALDNMVEEFNNSEGRNYGIEVTAVGKGSIDTIEEELLLNVDNQEELPNIVSAYADTIETLDKQAFIIPLNKYMKDDEFNNYVQGYLEDGRLHENEDVKIFPIAKATEIMILNKNAWSSFAEACNIQLEDLNTWEGLAKTAKTYFDYSNGKSFFGRDALMNYLSVGSKELGQNIFNVNDGIIQLDKTTLRILWDNFYIPYMKGYYVTNGKFASDDMKTMDIIASISSTASAAFYPSQIIVDEDATIDSEYLVIPVPHFQKEKQYVISQGAGMSVIKSNETKEYASFHFLKWFTEKQRNIVFSAQASYLPTRVDASDETIWQQVVADSDIEPTKLQQDVLSCSIKQINENIPYSMKAFEGSNDARNILESALFTTAKKDQQTVRELIESGIAPEEAWKTYESESYFNQWFENVSQQLQLIHTGADS